jgi:homodimeric pyruvate:ferredoxin (flavodoxin) oxidoreductase
MAMLQRRSNDMCKRATQQASQHLRLFSTTTAKTATDEQQPPPLPQAKPKSFASGIKQSRSIDMPMLSSEGKSIRALDGNTAAAHVAYAFSDVSFIYPISPSTSMGETMDKFAVSGRKNVFGQTVKVRQMQSELGSSGALHGALSGGALCTTFTCSQGLLLMIPNMYLVAGELLPAVFHISARALARQSLSIFCDHSDVMAVRPSGCAMLNACNPQEVMDMGVVAHLAALKSSVPFVHFFDGTRTSSVIECVKPISYSSIKSLMPWDKVHEFRQRGLNPQHPIMRGLGQDPQVYYQAAVAANSHYDAVPGLVQETMDELAAITGRHYKLFDYYGDPEAERVVVIMGSAGKTAEEAVDYMRAQGEKVGALKVRLFRPWSVEHFLQVLPPSVKSIAVLDRTKEDMASSLPIHADVLTSLSEAGQFKKVVGGSYGLGSKEFAPRHVKAVFDNLKQAEPKNHYTVGINDDVTHSSLPIGPAINTIPEGTTQALFFGLGSDGTVGANKAAASIIGERTEMFSQGHFNYSSQKAGASTVSHLRFGPEEIRSEYEIEESPGADYVACHNTSFLPKFDMVGKARPGASFVVNCPWSTIEELDNEFPAKLRRDIAEKQVDLYTIDAHAVAASVGLPAKRINQIMQGTFFHLSGILPPDDARAQLDAAIDRMYGKKSPQIVSANKNALAAAVTNLNKIEYPESWINAEESAKSAKKGDPSRTEYTPERDDWSNTFLKNIDSRSGDNLPVSAFQAGGTTPIGQSQWQKRALAEEVPVWLADSCTQCNLCSIVCPHAVVRPFLLNKKEMETVPEGYQARKAKGGELGGLQYTIQLAPYDCTGCAVCVEMCPDDSLVMKPQLHSMENHNEHWEYSLNKVSLKDNLMDRNSVKGSQFQDPLLEFSGACSGCGETPYVKLLTQMFGERMVIANSSGCSSVWGGSYGLSPFKTNKDGQGPAWARSLFEDTAEYGLGMTLASQQRREKLIADVQELVDASGEEQIASVELVAQLNKFLTVVDNPDKCQAMLPEIKRLLNAEKTTEVADELRKVQEGSDMFVNPSHWIIGGDGWAYDIGFGGLDHVLASGQNINILVLDTEGYSNTGFQLSKASPKGAAMKMAAGGNQAKKKDLGAIAMMHENAYVASVSLAADVNQTVKAFKEAEAYNGPSIIVAYATCVDWGHRLGDKAMVQQQVNAVESGYWPMYRYNPENQQKENVQAFELDNKRINKEATTSLLTNENRFASLQRTSPEHAKMLQTSMNDDNAFRHEVRRRKSMNDEDLLEHLKKMMGEQVAGERVTVLYGSDTGNAEVVAKNFQFELKRRGMKAKCLAFNEIDPADLQDESKVLAIVSTAGQGDMPKSAVKFWEQMETFLETAPEGFLSNTEYGVFGMGDSSYVFFNEAAKKIDNALLKLGATRLQDCGMGDDQHPARFDTELEEWSPDFFDNIKAPEPPQELGAPSHLIEVLDAEAAKSASPQTYIPSHSVPVTLKVKRSTVPEGYERPIDHFEFDLTGSGLTYDQGDSLGVWPSNDKVQVDTLLQSLGLTGDEVLSIKPIDSNRAEPLPEVLSVRTLFTEILDIGGWPKRRFYEMLKLAATDPKEQEELAHLCTKEGKADYQAYAAESYTYAELLAKFPSAKPSIGTLLDYIPDIKPRLYSIASSSRMRGDDECHLCIIKNDWDATSGRNCVGLCTGWLEQQNPGPEGIKMHGCVHPSAVTMPDTHKVPIVMVALGTGIAPMRAFIEERAQAKREGEECAEMALFFGARNRQEYSYEMEFDKYQEEGVLQHIHLALSREQKEKIYVTHRIQQQKELLYDLIHEKKGSFYLCGPGGNVPPQVRKGVIDSIRDIGGHSQEYADKYVDEMQITGRYNVEAW